MEIDRKSPIPIYVQLKEQIKIAIETEQYAVGDQLPTVRQQAVEFKINLNTVRKVYHELEEEGYISTQQGKGTFVCGIPSREEKDGDRLMRMDRLLDNLLAQGYALGFTASEILDLLATKVK
ncbi:GntR family transcriptional regulator [Syntrophomonas erecta]